MKRSIFERKVARDAHAQSDVFCDVYLPYSEFRKVSRT